MRTFEEINREIANCEDRMHNARTATKLARLDNNSGTVTQLIKEWAIARELDKQDASKQVIKLSEEHGELAGALLRGDMAEVKDAIGDMYVVLTILCMQLDLDIETCIQEAYEVIKNRTGKTVNGVFIKQEDL